MHLVVGGKGLIGTALCAQLASRGLPFACTTRDGGGGSVKCDLRNADDIFDLPSAKYVYLVAAMPRFNNCEGNQESWLVNADAPVEIARRYKHDAFVVFVSSDTVEWIGQAAYARQKAYVETYIHAIDGAIVRPCKVSPQRVDDLAARIVNIALAQRPGVMRWLG